MGDQNPTDILREEHEKVLKILDSLESSIEKENVNLAGANMSALLREFDRHSLNKEEKALFPELEKFLPREGGPTGMMIIEHKELLASMAKFDEALTSGNLKEASRTGSYIISLFREHIDKENNILFMIADMHLDEKQKRTILDGFKDIDSKG